MTSTDPTLTLGVYQPEAKDTDPEDRLRRLAAALADPGMRGCDLVICPELYLSGYFGGDRLAELAETGDGPFAAGVRALARKSGCAIVYGYPERVAGRVFNSALVAGPDGRAVANHRKSLLPHDYEDRYFAAGDRPTVFEVKGWRIGLLVCYEVEFPEAVRFHARAGCDLVVAPTACLQRWSVVARQVVPTRAFENGVFVAYANYAGSEMGNRYLGESVIASPWGEDLARAGREECVMTARLDKSQIRDARQRLKYLRDVEGCCYV